MHIIKVGINYQVAPIEIREKMTFSGDAATHAMVALNQEETILENVIFSTCNRTEVYAVVEEVRSGIQSIKYFLMDWFQMEPQECMQYFVTLSDQDAIQHLFELAAGLDSMVIGETQILGQVRDAFFLAQEHKTTNKTLNELFKRVITFAKRAHRDTAIGEQAVSVSYVAVELAKKIFGSIENQHVVILGAGETGELTLKNLQGAGVSKITVINRTLERAKLLAETFNANTVPYDQLSAVLVEADIVITSTASSKAVLTKEMLEPVERKRKGSPLFLIDIAVPRDIDPEIASLDSIFLYDMDDLEKIVRENLESRKTTASILKQQIATELTSFNNWIAMLDAVPVIKALTEKSTSIQEKTLASIHRKMPDLTEREMKVLQKHTKSIVHQLLEEPIRQAKTMGESKDALALFQDIFGLELEADGNASKHK